MKTVLIVILAAVSALLWSGYQKKSTELNSTNVALQTAQEELQKSEQLRQQAEEQLRKIRPAESVAGQLGAAPRVVPPPSWFQQKLEQDRAKANSMGAH